MDSIVRRVRNTQRSNIVFKDGTPSKSTITEGEELIALGKNRGLSLFRRQKGILWWMNFTKDGNETIEKDLKVEGNAEFSRDLTATGDLTVIGNLIGQRAYFHAGEVSGLNTSTYLQYGDGTRMASTNGHIMIRAGSITGISTCWNVVNVQNGEQGVLYAAADAKINGTTKFGTSNVSFNANSTGLKAINVQDRGVDTFVAGDVLSMYANLTGSGNIEGDVSNMNVSVEVTYDT
tara:strand:- start:5424 stop:6125 length:702 start_codon:yes stop_codon:yes gene_type:complete